MSFLYITHFIISTLFNLNQDPSNLTMGFFRPQIHSQRILYFYSPGLDQNAPYKLTDSLVFNQDSNGVFEITSAPPWLVPKHLKLDYEIVLFEVVSIGKHYVKIIGNSMNNREVFVSRQEGVLLFWPEFLLKVNSVDLLDPDQQNIYIKPLTHSSRINLKYTLLQPVEVQGDWLKVNLIDDNYELIESGWIQWKKDNILLIKYYLLS